MQGSWSHFHWGISCLSFTAEKQHAQEVADVPDRHVFWLFHNADAKDLLPFHQASVCYSVFCILDRWGFMGFCGDWGSVFSFWTLDDWCMSPKSFAVMRSCSLICLVCEFRPLQRKRENLLSSIDSVELIATGYRWCQKCSERLNSAYEYQVFS